MPVESSNQPHGWIRARVDQLLARQRLQRQAELEILDGQIDRPAAVTAELTETRAGHKKPASQNRPNLGTTP